MSRAVQCILFGLVKPQRLQIKNATLLLAFLLSVTITAVGQAVSRQQADSMIDALKTNKQGIERIDLLLNLAQFHVFKPGEEQIDFDSAKIYIDEAALLNKTLNSSNARGYQALTESYLLKEKGQSAEGKKMVEKAVSILETASNKHYLGRATYELSGYYAYQNPEERQTRVKLVERAVDCFEQAGTLNTNAYTLEMLGDLYSLNKEYEKAIQVLNRALEIYNITGHARLQGVYVVLGRSYRSLKDFPQSLLYMLKALKTAQAVGDSSMQLCQINNVLGVIYREMDNKEMSAKYLIAGLEVAKRHNDENAIYWLAVNLSIIYNELGQPGKALGVLDLISEKIRRSEDQFTKTNIAEAYLRTYIELGQFDKGQPYCDTVLSHADNNKISDSDKRLAYQLCVMYFVAAKQFQKARVYLTKNIDLQKKFPTGLASLQDEKLWYRVDSAYGNFQSAFNHLLFYKNKMDSIFSVNKVRQLQALEVEHETALKEDSIKAKNKDIDFLTQKNELQAANLKQSALIKNITIVGIILVLIIMGLVYRQYLHKQKSNNVITHKNELLQQALDDKEWLLKEIHHRVKNNLQIIMSLLDSQSIYIDDDAALTAINDSQRRVQAISLIHQKLYQSENTSSIDMRQYMDELISYLKDSFDSSNRIVFEKDIEPLKLDVTKAIPLGLIINESVVNAIKYAFPNGQQGLVRISLKYDGPDYLLLNISDNGIGLPSTIEISKQDSLGFSLMQGLTRQLDGVINMESKKGLHISIRFSALNHHPHE